jgi:periplasmic divalent cation tolerance protein
LHGNIVDAFNNCFRYLPLSAMKKFFLHWFNKIFSRETEIILIYTTFPDLKSAEKIISDLLQEKLIACANFHKIESHFLGEGTIADKSEIATIFKTSSANFSELSNRLHELHPYKIPCLLKMEVEANQEYSKWVKEVVK